MKVFSSYVAAKPVEWSLLPNVYCKKFKGLPIKDIISEGLNEKKESWEDNVKTLLKNRLKNCIIDEKTKTKYLKTKIKKLENKKLKLLKSRKIKSQTKLLNTNKIKKKRNNRPN